MKTIISSIIDLAILTSSTTAITASAIKTHTVLLDPALITSDTEIEHAKEDDHSAMTIGVITITPSTGKPFNITVDQFNEAYKVFVKAWAVIKPIKDGVTEGERTRISSAKKAAKAIADAAINQEKDAKRMERLNKAQLKAAETLKKAQEAAAKVAERAKIIEEGTKVAAALKETGAIKTEEAPVAAKPDKSKGKGK